MFVLVFRVKPPARFFEFPQALYGVYWVYGVKIPRRQAMDSFAGDLASLTIFTAIPAPPRAAQSFGTGIVGLLFFNLTGVDQPSFRVVKICFPISMREFLIPNLGSAFPSGLYQSLNNILSDSLNNTIDLFLFGCIGPYTFSLPFCNIGNLCLFRNSLLNEVPRLGGFLHDGFG